MFCYALLLVANIYSLRVTDAQVTGGVVKDGYVTDFAAKDARIKWTFTAKPGIYRARIHARTPGGEKGFGLEVNGHASSAMLPAKNEFFWQEAGIVELNAGPNTVLVKRGWGYYEVEGVDFSPAQIPAIKPVSSRLVTPNAIRAAKAIMQKFSRNYGRFTGSGQYELKDSAFITAKTGLTPMILGADFIESSPSRAAHGNKQSPPISDLIAQAKRGSVITISWHWNAPSKLKDTAAEPWWKGFYKEGTTFDLAAALADKNSTDYGLLIRDMDVIAKLLQQLQEAGVPILWRPLHEAEGGWFWWGASGAEPAKQLYRLMFDRFTRVHHLRNLIWVWNSPNPMWYPGDDVVDIMSLDRYPDDRTDALTSDWGELLSRFNGKKMLALAEFPGAPDVDRMAKFGVHFAYFVSWTGDLGPKGMTPQRLKSIYGSGRVLNLSKRAGPR